MGAYVRGMRCEGLSVRISSIPFALICVENTAGNKPTAFFDGVK